MKDQKRQILFLLFISLTLGLAPFYPDPHIVGKLKWFLGGAEELQFRLV